MNDQGGDGSGAAPGPRDYGCGLVACVAGLMLLGSVVGGIVALFADGLSAGWVVGALWLPFWFWIGMGAWRRTVWSGTH